MARVLVAMSGGVDSSVAAACLVADGHEVVGATMKLWGGPSDAGCCSVADVEDARRVARQLGIDHHVFNFSEDFERHVVEPFVAAHAQGRTPNPCVECNRHLKFDRLLRRADQLGFDSVATGHHARVTAASGRLALRRGVDPGKDQSYVLSMLDQPVLARLRLPVGHLRKSEVRDRARAGGLATASKPDSQDLCFVPAGARGRETFLGSRIPLGPGRVEDTGGRLVGTVPAVELVTVGQRRGLVPGGGPPRYALSVDVGRGVVVVGGSDQLLVSRLGLEGMTWVDRPAAPGTAVEVQVSAHGRTRRATYLGDGELDLDEPARRVAPGQTVALYSGDEVLGAGLAAGG